MKRMGKQATEITEQEALQRLAALCAAAEHCTGEMEEKMRRWGLAEEVQARVIERLVAERFVDDERYCRAFVADKMKYNKWGRRKIEQALRLKHIPRETSDAVFDELPGDAFADILRPLLKVKLRTLKAGSNYERRAKLLRFALSRGFTFDDARACMDVDGLSEEPGEF